MISGGRSGQALPIQAPAVMSGSTSGGPGPNCEIDAMGHVRTYAVQQKRLREAPVRLIAYRQVIQSRKA